VTLRILLLTAAVLAIAAAQTNATDDGQRFVIVVAGLRVTSADGVETRDFGASEGAEVEVVSRDGRFETRRAIAQAWKRGTATYFTADFAVAFQAAYDIRMTFRDGSVIRIADFILPEAWKTHFSFYNTTGTTSAASILRSESDASSGLRCHVYALWPWTAYQQMGGRQVARDQQP
jgi:hypothetical protein